jgi:REP element-mobilizing transposase RayT
MRHARIKGPANTAHHCFNRVINRSYLLSIPEKDRLRDWLQRVADFSGCILLGFAILDTHWHVLAIITARKRLSDFEFCKRLGCIYSRVTVETMATQLSALRSAGEHAAAEALRAPYIRRMHDISELFKTFKQPFTQRFNARHNRSGTLWNGRFNNLPIDRGGHGLLAVLLYLDLNASRAGIVTQPSTYRFCGFGAACGGDQRIRKAMLTHIAPLMGLGTTCSWKRFAKAYRLLLDSAGGHELTAENDADASVDETIEQLRAALADAEEVPWAHLMEQRVSWFTAGVVLGSAPFVDRMHHDYRLLLGWKRERQARQIPEAWPAGLYALGRPRVARSALT